MLAMTADEPGVSLDPFFEMRAADRKLVEEKKRKRSRSAAALMMGHRARFCASDFGNFGHYGNSADLLVCV
jgi:hypothetical protein